MILIGAVNLWRPGVVKEKERLFLKGSLSFSRFSSPFLHPFSASFRGMSVEFRHVFCGLLLPVYENILKDMKTLKKN